MDSSQTSILRLLRLFRAFRLMKVARYMRKIQVLFEAMAASWGVLILMLYLFVIVTVLASTLMYYSERGDYDTVDDVWVSNDERAHFENIPAGFYWAIVTMATVGFGDHVVGDCPKAECITPTGKVISSLFTVVGIVMISMPISIIGMNFNMSWTRMLSGGIAPPAEMMKGPSASGKLLSLPDELEASLLPLIDFMQMEEPDITGEARPVKARRPTIGGEALGKPEPKKGQLRRLLEAITKSNAMMKNVSQLLRERQVSMGSLVEESSVLQAEIAFLMLLQQTLLEIHDLTKEQVVESTFNAALKENKIRTEILSLFSKSKDPTPAAGHRRLISPPMLPGMADALESAAKGRWMRGANSGSPSPAASPRSQTTDNRGTTAPTHPASGRNIAATLANVEDELFNASVLEDPSLGDTLKELTLKKKAEASLDIGHAFT